MSFLANLFIVIGRPFYWLLVLLVRLLLSLITLGRSATKGLLPTRKSIRVLFVRGKKGFGLVKFPVLKQLLSRRSLGLLLGVLSASFVLTFFLFTFLNELPSPDRLATRRQSLSTKIYDRHGTLLYKIYRQENRTPVDIAELPSYLLQATVAIEDKDFFRHAGLSFSGIIRAAYQNLFQQKRVGGSTITQQLIKNALLSPEKTWKRKVKEAVLAILAEQKYSKIQILEMYLNQVGYGGAAYGIEEASQKYFGKPAKQLSLAQAALLAGLPASPTRFSPFGHQPQLAKEQQLKVLRRMAEDGYLSEPERQKVAEEPLNYISPGHEILAPHFVMYIKELVAQRYGERLLEEGGLEITTSLDLTIQNQVQEIVKQEVAKLGNLRITNGASLVTNPKTGEILAMVGSKDYFASGIDGNFNVTTAKRQPGSAIKPVNYSIALENGFTPASLLDDSPITYQIPGQPPYSPRNYDNRFHGLVPLRVALGSSYNVPAVKVLAAFGVNRMMRRGQEMGITDWQDPAQYGLSLTLGGGEVRMVDLAVAYGVLANSGIRVELNPILEIRDSRNDRLERSIRGQPTPVLSPEIAFLLTDILADNSARTPAFGPNSQLAIPNRAVAVKTGTTQNLRDNWTIGYTPSLLVAVWVGNNDNRPMSYVASGVSGASPIWRKTMEALLADQPVERFNRPEGIREVTICQTTGTLPCDGCPVVRNEYFLAGTEPQHRCNPEGFLPRTVSPPPNPSIW